MEFLIISGLSGAGKSRTMDILEDLNYYCVDNMPVLLIPRFAELCLSMQSRYGLVALVTDIRERNSTDELFNALDGLRKLGCEYKILFVEASPDVIVKRYKETRRRHPLADDGDSIEDAVINEINTLAPIRDHADYVLDTSLLTLGMLQSELYRMFMGNHGDRKLAVTIVSFGFKYGIPIDADLVFDVRFLPNPFYIPELRPLTGLDSPVFEYVFSQTHTSEFIRLLQQLLSFLLPQYVEEGKFGLTIAIGCTGGRHRSVAIAKTLTAFASDLGHEATLINRDIGK